MKLLLGPAGRPQEIWIDLALALTVLAHICGAGVVFRTLNPFCRQQVMLAYHAATLTALAVPDCVSVPRISGPSDTLLGVPGGLRLSAKALQRSVCDLCPA